MEDANVSLAAWGRARIYSVWYPYLSRNSLQYVRQSSLTDSGARSTCQRAWTKHIRHVGPSAATVAGTSPGGRCREEVRWIRSVEIRHTAHCTRFLFPLRDSRREKIASPPFFLVTTNKRIKFSKYRSSIFYSISELLCRSRWACCWLLRSLCLSSRGHR
jgi:hypothetical protein